MSILEKIDQLDNPGPWLSIIFLIVFIILISVTVFNQRQEHIEKMQCLQTHTMKECEK